MNKIRDVIDDVKFYDANTMSNADAIDWLPGFINSAIASYPNDRNKFLNAKLPDVFKPDFLAQGLTVDAVTVPLHTTPRQGPHPGIFAAGGEGAAFFAGEHGNANLLHELTHFAGGDAASDQAIINHFNIANGDIQGWFQNGCPD